MLELGPTVPIFGVCMGLQCIGEAFGGENLLLLSFDVVNLLESVLTGIVY